uniref:Phosphatidate phosphatase APP1 catalytic domain-containing protein n=1 Tax=uncultured Thiotrichaceae bacterium TaxID=298394 RepID=A0A6S6TXU2_9GAMM|nr:MAG: Unknown protein [uncultured Thiotrichaceae bacterium]
MKKPVTLTLLIIIFMSTNSWGNTIRKMGHSVETRFDTLRYRLKKDLKYDQPLQVVPYNGYGNQDTLFIKGRVLEHKGNIDDSTKESLWNNMVATYQRLESDEVPDLALKAHVYGTEYVTKTDEEGYFALSVPTPDNLDKTKLWHDISIEVLPQAAITATTTPVTGRIMLPPADCDFGIISDIDDTIMVTNATSLLAMARLTFAHSPATRLPFEGVADFYQALIHGSTAPRPIFYVSSSPWNLYDFLIEFMQLNHIPAGPLLLRDFGLTSEQLIQSSHHKHKLTQITDIMSTYPELPFILIGDSGQHDPEIYAEVVATRPGQVKAIYIRDVNQNTQRTDSISKLAREVQKHSIEMILVADTETAMAHALTQGYLQSKSPD